jgi:hypothetical protein
MKPHVVGFSSIGQIIPAIIAAGGKEQALQIIAMLVDQSTELAGLRDPNNISFGMAFLEDDIRDKGLVNKLYAHYRLLVEKKKLSYDDGVGFSSVLNMLGERKRASEVYLSSPPRNASATSHDAFDEDP